MNKSKKTSKTDTKRAKKGPASARTTRADEVIALLTRPEGVTIAEMQKAFKNQPHSCRALISVIGRANKLGVESKVDESRGRIYRATKEAK